MRDAEAQKLMYIYFLLTLGLQPFEGDIHFLVWTPDDDCYVESFFLKCRPLKIYDLLKWQTKSEWKKGGEIIQRRWWRKKNMRKKKLFFLPFFFQVLTLAESLLSLLGHTHTFCCSVDAGVVWGSFIFVLFESHSHFSSLTRFLLFFLVFPSKQNIVSRFFFTSFHRFPPSYFFCYTFRFRLSIPSCGFKGPKSQHRRSKKNWKQKPFTWSVPLFYCFLEPRKHLQKETTKMKGFRRAKVITQKCCTFLSPSFFAFFFSSIFLDVFPSVFPFFEARILRFFARF